MKKLFLCGSIVLTVCSTSALATVNFSTFVSSSSINALEGQNSTIGFTYAGNKFVGSVYFGSNNDQLYQTDLSGGNVQKFGNPLPVTASGEIAVAASLNNGGFSAGDIYAGDQNEGVIYHYSNSGGSATVFASGLSGGVKSILFDPGSSFGGNMLVTTSTGALYSITSTGAVTLLTNLGTVIEGMDIATANWGPLAGDLLIASEGAQAIYLIDKTTFSVVASLSIPIAETVSFVPLNLGSSGNPVEGFYDANYPVDIQKADASQFAGLQGDIIATSEEGGGSQVWDVKYSGNPLSPFSGGATQVGTLPNQSEDGIFVTAQRIQLSTPEPAGILLMGTVLAGLTQVLRRKRRA